MKEIVTFDKYYRPLYEGDYVMTKYGRVGKIVWRQTSAIIGYDLEPVGFFDAPPPDKFTLWDPHTLTKVDDFNNDYIIELMKQEGIKNVYTDR